MGITKCNHMDCCPECADRVAKLQAVVDAAKAVVDSGTMCMDVQVVSMAKFNALAETIKEVE